MFPKLYHHLTQLLPQQLMKTIKPYQLPEVFLNIYELYQFSANTSEQRFRSGWNYLDSSVGGNGSNAITYKVQVATLGSRSVTFTEQSSISSITLFEIGA